MKKFKQIFKCISFTLLIFLASPIFLMLKYLEWLTDEKYGEMIENILEEDDE